MADPHGVDIINDGLNPSMTAVAARAGFGHTTDLADRGAAFRKDGRSHFVFGDAKAIAQVSL